MKNQPYRKTLADDGTIEGSVEKRHDGLPGPGNGRVSSSCLFPNILKFVHQHTEAGAGAASVCVLVSKQLTQIWHHFFVLNISHFTLPLFPSESEHLLYLFSACFTSKKVTNIRRSETLRRV